MMDCNSNQRRAIGALALGIVAGFGFLAALYAATLN
jgi:hypothetical protein